MLSVLTKLLNSRKLLIQLVHLLWSLGLLGEFAGVALGPLGEFGDVTLHTTVRKRGRQVIGVRAVGGPGGNYVSS